ncbi:unnamed protein product [Urochloa decumbens]|uniref:DUF6598 domain-containing protein n=1 Tax=Urochloa decumbens TaxID=240449 RepID=A0ABC9CL66_9POAL
MGTERSQPCPSYHLTSDPLSLGSCAFMAAAAAAGGGDLGFGWRASVVEEEEEEDCAGRETFLSDELEAVADRESKQEARENQLCDWGLQADRAAGADMDRMSHRIPKQDGELSKLDLDGEYKYDDYDEEYADLEPFFFDEAEAVADHERRMRREQEEARRKEQEDHDLKVHNAAMDRIREYDPKLGRTYFTRIYFLNLSKFNLDEESPLGPMRDTNASINVHRTVFKGVRKQFLHGDSVHHTVFKGGRKQFRPGDSAETQSVKTVFSDDCEKLFVPGNSANVLSVKIASSDVGFPIDVYGTVIARDSLDLKCVYLFKCDRDHCQHITPKDELILTGPKRGLALIDAIYFEVDLKIKGGPGQKDKQLSKVLLTLDGRPVELDDEIVVERKSVDTMLSKVVVTYAVVRRAIEATIAIEVLQGRFSGLITACTTSIRNSIVLHDSRVTKGMTVHAKGAIQLLRCVVAVCFKEKLVVTIAARNGLKSIIKFTPRVNGGDENEVTCGSIKLRVKVTWSIIFRDYLG